MRFLQKASKWLKGLSGNSIYYSHRHYYYGKILSDFNEIGSYITLFEECSNENYLKTKKEICFSNSLKFGSTAKDIKKKLHKPHYHIVGKAPVNTNVFIYKLFLGKHKVRLELHSFEDKLFLFKYTFSSLTPESKNEVIDILQKKYLSKSADFSNQNIVDNFNSCIHIDDSINFSISYLNLNCDFLRYIKQITETEKNKYFENKILDYKELYFSL